MEDIDEEDLQLIDDHNHNSRALCSPVQVFVDSDSSSDTCESDTVTLGSASRFLMNAMSAEEYRTVYWPKLETAIDQLLTQNPLDHISISYEQIYSHVYKCVCQQHSELLYNDLIWKIRCHLDRVSSELQASPAECFIENFNVALTQYTAALHCIVPVFIYMNKFYIETKLNRDLRDDLMKLFSDHVAEKHIDTLLPLLINAHSMPFKVKPSTMAGVVKGLYALRPDSFLRYSLQLLNLSFSFTPLKTRNFSWSCHRTASAEAISHGSERVRNRDGFACEMSLLV